MTLHYPDTRFEVSHKKASAYTLNLFSHDPPYAVL